MDHSPSAARRLAFWRLRYPVELPPEAEAGYLRYLRLHAGEYLEDLLRARDVPGLRFLLERTAPEEPVLSAALALARDLGETEALAVLLEERRRRFPSGFEKTFDL